MKIAIVGSSGYIAKFIIEKLELENINDIIKIDKTLDADQYLDLNDVKQFNYKVLETIDYVIFTAAISSPDMCRNNFNLCWNINVKGTKYFIEKAIENNCKVIFFSSDAVFSNSCETFFNEKTETNANTPYGKMKKEIEDIFKNNNNFKSIRLSYVLSKIDRFVSYCLSCIERDEVAEVFHPFYRNVITVHNVVDVVYWLIKNWENFPFTFLNVVGLELVSRVRIADEINRIYKDRLKYKIIRPGNEFYENRPAITQMTSLYLFKYNILDKNNFTEIIQKELE